MGLRAKGFRALGLRFSLGFMAQGLGSRRAALGLRV